MSDMDAIENTVRQKWEFGHKTAECAMADFTSGECTCGYGDVFDLLSIIDKKDEENELLLATMFEIHVASVVDDVPLLLLLAKIRDLSQDALGYPDD